MTDSASPVKDKLISGGKQYLAYAAGFLAVVLLLRLYEAFVLGTIYHFPPNSIRFELIGFKYDLLVYLKICAFLFIPFLLFYLIRTGFATVFFIIITCFLVVINVALQQYFANSMVPLGSDLFAYSWAEITHTVGAAGGMSVTKLIPFIIFLSITLLAWFTMRKRKFWFAVLYPFLALSAGAVFINGAVPNPKRYPTDFDSFLACNKLGYFSSKSFDYFRNKYEDQKALENFDAANAYQDTSDHSFCYVNKDYPLMHLDESQDVLGKFFKTGEEKPNFVFIIVESLGRAYCGENAYLGSFTPFLDSLMQKSLYWENFLSTGGRTFAVLPSTFASAPYGEKGFAEMGESMPEHLSLIRLLKERGYYSSFIYGGDAHFDLMDVFLKRQGIDLVVDSKSFGAGYTKLPASDEGFTWGYGDKEIFRKLLEVMDKGPGKPHLDIVLTLAMHSPFKVNDQETYNRKFEKRLTDLKLDEQKKADRRNYARQYATILYFDDALRSFFTEYS
ncbi:MAG TPA: sulfatase-like hydrolase/transferase, partial [Bacteroidales bacterium]